MKKKLERQEVIVNQFIWKENGFVIPAGELLFALTTLTQCYNKSCYLGHQGVVEYLTSLGLIEQQETGYKICDGKHRACSSLGNRVSNAVDNELRSLALDTEVSCPGINSIKAYKKNPEDGVYVPVATEDLKQCTKKKAK